MYTGVVIITVHYISLLHVYTGVVIIIGHCIRLLHVYTGVVIIIVHCIRLLHVYITIVHCIRLLRVCITKHLIGDFSCYIRRCMCPEICAIMVSGISTHYGLLGPHYFCIILQCSMNDVALNTIWCKILTVENLTNQD